MAKKMCKCAICNIDFDRNSIQAVKYGARRYAHFSCYPKGELVEMEKKQEEDPDFLKLKNYISSLFETPNWSMINKQIKDYINNYNYSYLGILKSLIFFYDIKKNDKSKANNAIGIVPYIYQQAYDYYLAIFKAQQNSDVVLKEETIEYVIKVPQHTKKRIKLLGLGVDEEDE